MSNYISQTIVSLVCIISKIMSESYVKLYQSDDCIPCMLYLRNHESYVKQDEL